MDPTGNISLEKPLPGSIEWHESGGEIVTVSPDRNSSFPKSAQALYDAIKKNRSCQKFIRKKMMQIETRMEENKELRGRVKFLKDYQVACRKRTGRALSRKKDARVQLISVPKLRANAKVDEKKVSAFYHGPAENSQVANYRMALEKFPLILSRAKWTKEEKENLAKGIKQQFQEMLLQKSVDICSEAGVDTNDFDSMIVSIRDHDITSEDIRLFLPKVNWEQLASMYIMGRSGAECESRWLNCEDPLINHHPWTKLEDKNLLHIVQQRGFSNWIDIAVALGTNRTPFQCLARYQRSLNASILKRGWSEDEDDKLRAAVAACGESNWQVVAATMEGRTGTQCSNRWTKSLNPIRQRVGRWSSNEDKRLKIALMLFGGKNWYKIAQFIPGRTQVQCRERWVNCLDPSLNMGEWTEEEDSRLRAAISEHGYSWSKVAACVAPRTDSQCRRRWAVLLPHEVPLLKAARKIQKEALISNFVDRESERPALGPNDFIPLTIESIPESENLNCPQRRKRKPRPPEHNENESASGCVPIRRSKRLRKKSLNSSDKVLRLTDGDEVGDGDVSKKKRKRWKSRSMNEKQIASLQALSLTCPDTFVLPITNGEEVRAVRRDKSKKKKSKKKMEPSEQKRKLGIRGEPEADTLSEVDDIPYRNREKPCPRENESSYPACIEVAEFGAEEAQAINEFNEIEASGVGDDLFMNKIREIKRCNKNKKCKKNTPAGPTQDHLSTSPDIPSLGESLPSRCTRLETGVATGENVSVAAGDSAPLCEERPLRCSTPDIIDCWNSRSSSSPTPSRHEKSKTKDRACPKKKTTTEYENDVTLAFFLQKTGKHRKPALLSSKVSTLQPKVGASTDVVECSQNFRLPPKCPTSDIPEDQSSTAFGACKQQRMPKQAKKRKQSGSCEKSETPDEDDITLASFIFKLKKRRFE